MGMNQACLYNTGSVMCSDERTLDFDFCQTHLATPRGRQHMADVVERGRITKGSDIERLIKAADEIPELDHQTSALMQMVDLVDRISDWVTASEQRLNRVPESEWRYRDRTGEQVRSEVLIYERALDRAGKALGQVSKMAINDKITSLGRAQTELMIKIMLGVLGEMPLDPKIIEVGKGILLRKFQEEAALAPKLAHHTQKQLESAVVDASDVNGFDFNGNS